MRQPTAGGAGNLSREQGDMVLERIFPVTVSPSRWPPFSVTLSEAKGLAVQLRVNHALSEANVSAKGLGVRTARFFASLRMTNGGRWLAIVGLALFLSAVTLCGEEEFTIDFPYPLVGREKFPTVNEIDEIAGKPGPQVALLFTVCPVDRRQDQNDYYAPAWSPDGQSLSILRADIKKRTSKIVLLPTLSEPKPITLLDSEQDSYDYMLSWAPTRASGGCYFVFSSTVSPSGNLDVYLSAIEGNPSRVKNPVRLTKGQVLRRYPTMFQAGKGSRLLFCDGPVVKEVTMPSDLSGLLSAVPAGKSFGDVTERMGQEVSLGYGNYPTRAPDGSAVAYAKQKGEEAGHTVYDLYLHRPDGIERPLAAEPGFRVRTPAWSPDGRRVAFYAAKGSGAWGLYAVDVQAMRPIVQQVAESAATEDNFDFVGPAWLSSGQGLLYLVPSLQFGGHYALRWAPLDGKTGGEIAYPAELTTANDLAISPQKGVLEAAFAATRRVAQDVYVMIVTEP